MLGIGPMGSWNENGVAVANCSAASEGTERRE